MKENEKLTLIPLKKSGLIQMIRMVKSIWHKWVKKLFMSYEKVGVRLKPACSAMDDLEVYLNIEYKNLS